jgi:hypothetical protein
MRIHPLLLPLAMLLVGCGGPGGGTVTGTVTLDGRLVNHGTVAYQSANGKVVSAMIRPDGTYEAVGVPVGEAVITVQTYPVAPTMAPPGSGPVMSPTAARYTPVPYVYGDAKRSPLRYTVQAGDQPHDLALTRRAR